MGVKLMKKLSKRAIFKQLLLQDVLNILETNRAMQLQSIRQELKGSLSSKYYLQNCTAEGYCFVGGYNDRWYRAIQSVVGAELVIKKFEGKLYAMLNNNFWTNAITKNAMTDWTANYNR
jgi:hypothetical protein|tara:strand:+ start:15945 stop:16301 length:357 start_codon:yes stop_codon:yes gene_type:complete